MADTVQMNLNVQPETRERVKEMAISTFRSPGKLIDWLVDEAYKRLQQEPVGESDGHENSDTLHA